MKTWEYLKIWDNPGVEKMNELGKQGWELVGTGIECIEECDECKEYILQKKNIHYNQKYTYRTKLYFKREKK
jgi:hypothetical protein